VIVALIAVKPVNAPVAIKPVDAAEAVQVIIPAIAPQVVVVRGAEQIVRVRGSSALHHRILPVNRGWTGTPMGRVARPAGSRLREKMTY
jgi:hypothetical protein